MRPSADLVSILVQTIVNNLAITSDDQLALLVNGLGATPPWSSRSLRETRCWSCAAGPAGLAGLGPGTFLSALDMPGCSLSLMKLTDERLDLLDAAADASAWPRGGRSARSEAGHSRSGRLRLRTLPFKQRNRLRCAVRSKPPPMRS